MTTQEKFDVWDSTHPTLAEVKEYLNRLKRVTPLQLVYREQRRDIVCNQYSFHARENLLGILLPDSNKLVRVATVGKNILFRLSRADLADAFLKKMRRIMSAIERVANYTDCAAGQTNRMSFALPIRMASADDIAVLNTCRKAFKETLDVLKYCGVNVFADVDVQHLAWVDKNETCTYAGAQEPSLIYDYVNRVGDILIFSDYEPPQKCRHH